MDTKICTYVCDQVTLRWKPVRAPPIMYSQATVRSNTKDQAVLRRDYTLKQGKGKWWFASTIKQTSMPREGAVVGHCTAIRRVRSRSPCRLPVSALSLTQRGGNHPVHLQRKTPDNSKTRGGDIRGILYPPSAMRPSLNPAIGASSVQP